MELILISNCKLKIMLSADDMKKYGIDTAGESAMRRGFRPVLERAHDDCGFDIDSGRLLVQVFPSRQGGCEMFITRISVTERGEAGEMPQPPTVCILRTAEELCSLCRALSARGRGKTSDAYLLEDAGFALILPEFEGGEQLPLEASVISEFTEPRAGDSLFSYIKEHARPIITGNAVERLARL